MSAALDPTLAGLTGCGCCHGVSIQTPVGIFNRPGLSAIAYRIGTHSRFKATLQAQLSSSAFPALHPLSTRDDDDFTMALLDAWSTVADVLTFYQERIANEAFLRTATERLSVLEMARLIGYRLDPGVAAGTWLALEIESASGAFGQALAAGNSIQAPLQPPPPVTVEAGLKVQSIPGPGEDPQTFETIEGIEARVEWNGLRPRQTELHLPAPDDTQMYLKGTSTNLQAGSAIVIVGSERVEDPTSDHWEFRRVSQVEIDNVANRTRITLDQALGTGSPEAVDPGNSPKVYALRLRAALFGHNAPDWVTLPVALRIGDFLPESPDFIPGAFADHKDKWADQKFPSGQESIDLDAVYPQIAVDSWIVLRNANNTELYRVENVAEASHARFNITGKATQLTIQDHNIDQFSPRDASVFAQSEELELAEFPLDDPITGKEIVVQGRFDDLPSGRILLLKGKRMRVRIRPEAADLELVSETDPSRSTDVTAGDSFIVLQPATPVQGTPARHTWRLEDEAGFQGILEVSDELIEFIPADENDDDVVELLELQSVDPEDKTHSRITFSEDLKNVCDRTTVVIFANVAPATHGETVREILGSGDASKEFQRFTLKQPPVTYVSAATPSGSISTLEARVNDVLWLEVPTFHGRGPDERIYVTRLDDDGKTTVIFGNGVEGARLPTGQANITAKYRKGIGLGGLLKPGQLSQLMTRPLGLKAAVNPLASEGAEDPDELEQARSNAPITVLTLDRVVSLRDYEDFARAYAGVDKALATRVWVGQSQGVFLTIAGPMGAAINEDSTTFNNLVEALETYGDPRTIVIVRSYRPRFFRVAGTVTLEPDRLIEVVEPLIVEKLRAHYAFASRQFGQPVARSGVIALIHSVEGVKWVDIDALYRSDEDAAAHALLAADFPHPGTQELLPAELLTLDPAPLDLEVTL